MKHNKKIFKTLDMIRYWSLTNGFYDWTAEINDVIDKVIELERELLEKKEELEKLKIRIKQ